MESIERKVENYAVVFNVNLVRATLNEAVEFKDYLAETIHDSNKDIIVNLSACEHLDSTFLGVLVSGYKKLKSQNRSLVIIEPVDQSSIFLTLNSIGKIFPLYTNVKVALEDIENKKLIEKEINALNENQINPIEKPTKFKYKIESQQLADSPIEPVQEATKGNEFNTGTLPNNNCQETTENKPVFENNRSEKDELNMIQFNHTEKELENHSSLNNEETVVDTNIPDFESNENEDSKTFIFKHKRATEKVHFSGGNVKWEFGFN
jgi:anti-anti-sigma factor